MQYALNPRDVPLVFQPPCPEIVTFARDFAAGHYPKARLQMTVRNCVHRARQRGQGSCP